MIKKWISEERAKTDEFEDAGPRVPKPQLEKPHETKLERNVPKQQPTHTSQWREKVDATCDIN